MQLASTQKHQSHLWSRANKLKLSFSLLLNLTDVSYFIALKCRHFAIPAIPELVLPHAMFSPHSFKLDPS